MQAPYWLSVSITDLCVYIVNDTRPTAVKVVCSASFTLTNVFASTYAHTAPRCDEVTGILKLCRDIENLTSWPFKIRHFSYIYVILESQMQNIPKTLTKRQSCANGRNEIIYLNLFLCCGQVAQSV
jgi:hypothetical protein